ncbi:hypothetical protein H7170_01720 [Candidatus Gracilibacteria bacterium]|nr:hypothetical protein [Candidatus Gracilibacteria bacterium]
MSNNSLHNRKIFQNNTDISRYCIGVFGEKFEIRYCNFGFVVIPISGLFVYKYYLGSKDDPLLFGNREAKNYLFFHQNGVLIPIYEVLGDICIGNQVFMRAKIQNIRMTSKKFVSFCDFDIQQLAMIITQIHTIYPGYIHGNIHPSNFFLNTSGKIGVFDLITYAIGPRERDISRIFMHARYDVDFLKHFLVFYKFDISLKKVYLIALIELRELMKMGYATDFEIEIKKLITLIQS